MIEHNPDKFYGHQQRLAPAVVKRETTVASGTYQCTSAANLNKLHMISSVEGCNILRGTGASVTATSGFYLPPNTIFFFRPVSGAESIGYAALTGTLSIVTVGVVE